MSNRLDKLFPASFRGVRFLTDMEKEPALGRKKVIHDYPNSGKRFVQDLGPIVGEFEVTAIIHGENYQEQKEALKSALNKEGIGRLVLPHTGAVNVEALPYSIEYDQKSVGVIAFALKFSISNTTDVPAVTPATLEDVFQAGDEARLGLQNQTIEDYEVPKARKDVLTAIEDYTQSVVSTVNKYTAKTGGNNSRIQSIVLEVERSATALIRNPQQMAKQVIYGDEALINGMFATFSALFTDPDVESSEKISASVALENQDFGKDLKDNGTDPSVSGMPLWPPNTANRILRNNNRVLMIENVRLNSLIVAFEVAANFDYQTAGDINRTIQILETAYSNMILVADPDGILSTNDDIKLLIDTVKNSAYEVLDQKAQQVYSTTLLNFQGVNSVMNLTYRLYKERLESELDLEELAELVVDLNPDLTPGEMSGEVIGFES